MGVRESLRQQWLGVSLGLLALLVALNGPAVAADVVSSAARKITGKQIKDRTITERDISRRTLKRLAGKRGPQGATGERGATGEAGSAGSPDTGAEILAKLAAVAGAGSGLNADLLDGIEASALVGAADNAGGDLDGPFSNLQLKNGVVGAAQIGQGVVNRGHLRDFPDAFTVVDPPPLDPGECHMKTETVADVDVGSILMPVAGGPFDFPAGFYTPVIAVAQEDEVQFVVCNGSGVQADADATFFVQEILRYGN